MRKRTKRVFKEIIESKLSSFIIAVIVCYFEGIPVLAATKLSVIILCFTLVKDFFLKKYQHNRLVRESKEKTLTP